MSIATLKRKTQVKYNNMSVGHKQFSLNGTHRNQGYVGQTMLSRSLPTTLMKGNVIRGHGGCCGHYPVKPIVQSGVNYQEDSRVVKPSVLNTAGMIVNKYHCIGECTSGENVCDKSSKRINHVKPDNNNNNNIQSDHLNALRRKSIIDTNKCNIIKANDTYVQAKCDKSLKLTRPSLICAIPKVEPPKKCVPIVDDKKNENVNRNVPFACSGVVIHAYKF